MFEVLAANYERDYSADGYWRVVSWTVIGTAISMEDAKSRFVAPTLRWVRQP